MASKSKNLATVVRDPPIARWLFADTRVAWMWLAVRLYLGWQWLEAGWHKIQDAAWVGGGAAVQGFWNRIVQIPEPPARPPITYDWYRGLIGALLEGGHYSWFGKLVAYGEVLVGIGVILGALVGITAFFGAFMNFNFMLAGSASSNPVLFILAVMLMMAWKVAGYYGLDRWLLPVLGTPWQPAREIRTELGQPVSQASA